MVDRTVYLVESVTDAMIDHELTFVSDTDLARLMQSGWEATTNMPRTVTVREEKVAATMLILRKAEENRGVSVVEPQHGGLMDTGESASRGGRATIVRVNEFGNREVVSMQDMLVKALEGMGRGLANLGEHPGHLGAPGQHNLPGLTVISGTKVSQAFDMGLLAGMRGEGLSANPFPGGSDASNKWVEGHAHAKEARTQVASPVEIAEARAIGLRLAKRLGPDNPSEVSCPYQHPALVAAWVAGFKEGGGQVVGG